MLNRQAGSLTSRIAVACAAVMVSLGSASIAANAATMEIQFTGMDLVYNGSSFYDAGSISGGLANPAQADPLAAVSFLVDGSPVGTLTSDISLDFLINGVTGISSASGTVYNTTVPAPAGFFDLLIGTAPLASEFLVVDLDEVNVTYVDVANTVQFTFGAALADTYAQNLPFGLEFTGPLTISFSAQVEQGSRTTAGNLVTGFTAIGSGEYGGTLIPEPSSGILGALAAAACVCLCRRKSNTSA